ncbi:MAG: hypothetical protein U9Q34_08490 [Elusimicrobiota bacterium]|nr:hypothetical protein [Elusimicrobiota bacterium]
MIKKMLSSGRPKRKRVIRHRIKSRVKVRKKLLKKLAITVLGVLLITVLFVSLKMVYKAASVKIKSGILNSEIKSFDIKIGSKRMKSEILDLFKGRVGQKWNKDIKNEIQKDLLASHPYIDNIKVSKNILTGKVVITGQLAKIVSKIVLNKKEYYLAFSGKIFLSVYKEALKQNFIRTEVSAPKNPKLKIFAEFINKVNLSRKTFKLDPTLIKYDLNKKECSITLEDGSLVNWGEFEMTDLKILRLNRVLSDGSGKISPPYNIDLRHFAIGKILISKL